MDVFPFDLERLDKKMKGSMFLVMALLGVLLMSRVVESLENDIAADEDCKTKTCPTTNEARWAIRKLMMWIRIRNLVFNFYNTIILKEEVTQTKSITLQPEFACVNRTVG